MYYDKLCDLGIKLTRHSGTEKTYCPECTNTRKNKKDKPLSVNITTGEYNCHNCGWKGNVRSFEKHRESKKYEKPPADVLKSIQLKERAISWFAKRSISKETLEKFMIYSVEEYMPQTQKKENCICFPYMKNGEVVNVKYRDGNKNFKLFKDAELIFFNLNNIGNKKHVVITEGEIDCLSVYESGMGKEYEPVNADVDVETGEIKTKPHPYSVWCPVSVPNGASKGNQRLEYLDNCSDWFVGLDEIVIATDGDESGIALKDELIRRIGVERCRILKYPPDCLVPDKNGNKRSCKDLNEVLVYMGKEAVISCIENAEYIPVDGVYYIEDIFPGMLDNFRKGIKLAPTTRFETVDEYFRWKKGDINLFTGYANYGKTTFAIQLMLIKSIWDGWKWAIFSPENYPANDFYDDIVEMYVGKWLKDMTEKQYVDACYFINEHFFYVYPDNNHDIHSINEKFRYLVLKKGVDGVMIDPFNQLDHLFKPYQREDQYLSEILKDVKRFALLNNVVYNIITHPVKPTRDADRSLPPVDIYDIAGGAMWGNKADNILSYHRPNHHVDKTSPDVQVYVQKVKRKRTGGNTGDFPLKMLWSQKRFSDPLNNQIPCDPILASSQKQKDVESGSLPFDIHEFD